MSGHFHVAIHARSAGVATGPRVSLAQREFQTLAPSAAELAETFGRTFEDVRDALERLPRMFVEPDGSFVWVSASGEPAWQLDGMLYDRNERLLYVELKGTCPADRLDELLAVLGWPQTPVMFQLLREAVYLSEADFRGFRESLSGR